MQQNEAAVWKQNLLYSVNYLELLRESSSLAIISITNYKDQISIQNYMQLKSSIDARGKAIAWKPNLCVCVLGRRPGFIAAQCSQASHKLTVHFSFIPHFL